jgi:hypothetical protein
MVLERYHHVMAIILFIAEAAGNNISRNPNSVVSIGE